MGADGFETVISCFHMAIYSNNNTFRGPKQLPGRGQQTGKAPTAGGKDVNLEMNRDIAIDGVLSGAEPFIF